MIRKLFIVGVFLFCARAAYAVQASENFSDASSTETCGSNTVIDNLGPLTSCVEFVYNGGFSGSNGTTWFKGPTSGTTLNGPKINVVDGATANGIQFGAGSTGTAGAPSRTSVANTVTQGVTQTFCATWLGGLAATGIHIYKKDATGNFGEVSYSGTTAGTTAITDDSAQNLVLGNARGTTAPKPFVGDLHYIKIWNRVLTTNEMMAGTTWVYKNPSGLVFNRWFADPTGRDLSGNGNTCTQSGNIIAGTTGAQLIAGGMGSE